MAVKIANLEIKSTVRDLRKSGIYCIRNLDEKVKNKIPLDYEFLLIDGTSNCSFCRDIEELFNSVPPDKEPGDQSVKKSDESEKNEPGYNKIFRSLSRLIEKLPGRIIIVGIKPKFWDEFIKLKRQNGDNQKPIIIQTGQDETIKVPVDLTAIWNWIQSRIVWITEFEKVEITCKLVEKESGNDFYILPIKPPPKTTKINEKDLIIYLYSSWLKSFPFNEIEIQLDLIGKGQSVENIDGEFILNHLIELNDCLNKTIKGEHYRKLIDALGNESNINIDRFLSNIEFSETADFHLAKKDLRDLLVDLGNQRNLKFPSIFDIGKTIIDNNSRLSYTLFLKNQTKAMKSVKLKYERHFTLQSNKISEYPYQEVLSGNQSHFGILYNIFSGNDNRRKAEWFFQLIENGLSHIVVADERIADFTSRNPQLKVAFNCAGITVLESLEGLLEDVVPFCGGTNPTVFHESSNDIRGRRLSILIIHQGILDKSGLDVKKVEDRIDKWKKNFFSFVVVTSGRGTPANIPENARFIPFSVLESTLLTSSFSKLILIKTIFKSLSGRS